MKQSLLVASLALLPNFLNAAQVDPSTAATIGTHFLQYRAVPSARQEAPHLDLVERMTSAGSNPADLSGATTYYYVFNLHGGAGFVIVAGDDAVAPILGYSDQNAFDPAQVPENMAKWMERYKKAIAAAGAAHAVAPEDVRVKWEDLLQADGSQTRDNERAVNPLLQTTWNQSPYYNALCPFDADANERTVTGCVATAMSQIMKFWSYPTTGLGFHSYDHQLYGTLSANFAGTTYNWGGMPNNVTSNNNAVATLMYQVGVSVEMNYGIASTGGSGAYVISAMSPVQHCSEYALETYFGYDQGLQGVQRDNYTQSAWINLLKAELDNGRPILYAGFGPGGGHCWDLDGYDNNNLFHANWGWGGYSNGYFAIGDMSPPGVGIGGGDGDFNSGQQAVVGEIKPPDGGGPTDEFDMRLYDYITPSANTIYYGDAFSVTTNVWNAGTTDFSGDYCTALFDAQYNFVDYVEVLTGATLQAGFVYTSPGITFNNAGSFALLPGQYYIAAFYRPTNGDWQQIADDAGYTNMVPFNVINPNNVEMYADMNVTSGLPMVAGSPVSVTLDVANFGPTDINSYFDLSLYNLDGTPAFDIGTTAELALCTPCHFNGGLQFDNPSLDVAPGTYLMAVLYYADVNNAWQLVGSTNYANPILVTVQAPGLNPDIYEVNNDYAGAYTFTPAYTNDVAEVNTLGSNCHVGSDDDFYRFALPAGYDYTIHARLHDSYNSGDGGTYSLDALFSYSTDGTNWSDVYDDVMPNDIVQSGGGTITFHVAPYFQGAVGTYTLRWDITRDLSTGIATTGNTGDLQVFPDPAIDQLNVTGALLPGATVEVVNVQGQQLRTAVLDGSMKRTSIDVSSLAPGVYYVRLSTEQGLVTRSFVKAE